jgi:phytoene dehydrogenase-like protein
MNPPGDSASGACDPDAIVIGAGPNGLIAANLLADAGWNVLVLEAQSTPGGAVRSAELAAPGFVADVCSSCYPLGLASPVIRNLALEAHGLRWSHAPLALAHPTPDGCVLVDPSDPGATAASVDAFARGDGRVWEQLFRRWERAGPAVVDTLFSPFPPVRAATRAARAVGPRDLLGFTRMSLWSLDRIARQFDGEGGALLLGGNTAHTDLSMSAATGAMFGWMLACLAQSVGFPVVEGGAGRLTDALVSRLVAAGGALRFDSPVAGVIVRDGKAHGVVIADGTELRARKAVLADTSAPSLYFDLVGAEHLPRRVLRTLRRFRWDHGTVKVDWALTGAIPWIAEPARRAGVVHVIDSLAALRTATAQLEDGHVPADPFMIVGQTTTADATRSPPGSEAAWAYTHVPQEIRGDAGAPDGGEVTGRWDDADTARMADRIETQIERRAPGFRELIHARHIHTPASLQALDANLVGGAVGGGTAALRQQLCFRPTLTLHGGSRTPIGDLYLASAGAHPGGGVHGACGANAAHAALRRSG